MSRGAKSLGRHKGSTTFKRAKIQPVTFNSSSVRATSSRYNRFSSLSSLEDMDYTPDTNKTNLEKSYKPPPIVADVNVSLKEIKHILGDDCVYKRTSIGTKIFPLTLEKYEFCKKSLSEGKIEYHTFNSKANRTYTTFLYGLPRVDKNDIINELKNYNLSPTSISEVNTKYSSENDAVYKVQFLQKMFNPSSLQIVKTICNVIIYWKKSKPKKNNNPTQCWKCLMYGHGGEHCNRKPACMTCANNHLTSDCPYTKNNKRPAAFSCFNCKKHGNERTDHSANDLKCPLRALYLEIRSNATNRQPKRAHKRSYSSNVPLNTQTNRNSSHSFGNSQYDGRSYAGVAREANNDLFNIDQLFNIFTSSLDELSRCTTKIQQIQVVMSLLKYAYDIK